MDKKLVQTLRDALREAEEHLEYCGYGDRYEREIARERKLVERIAEALKEADVFLKGRVTDEHT